jgi:hypothetical protein
MGREKAVRLGPRDAGGLMGKLYVVREQHENQSGLSSIVTPPEGRIGIPVDRPITKTAHGADPIKARVIIADVESPERLGVVDTARERAQIERVAL